MSLFIRIAIPGKGLIHDMRAKGLVSKLCSTEDFGNASVKLSAEILFTIMVPERV